MLIENNNRSFQKVQVSFFYSFQLQGCRHQKTQQFTNPRNVFLFAGTRRFGFKLKTQQGLGKRKNETELGGENCDSSSMTTSWQCNEITSGVFYFTQEKKMFFCEFTTKGEGTGKLATSQ